MAHKQRVFSGVQPTGNLHLGNYLGAIKQWVNLQHQYECLFCIVDYHAITVPQDPAALRAATLETAAAYIAAGIDPEKQTIFAQSSVNYHTELAWILNCHTPLGWLNRMTQFKEKSQKAIRHLETFLRRRNEMAHNNYNLESDIDYLIYALKERANENELKELSSALKDMEVSKNKANAGLYTYPILMAADILLYKATHVPVGEDQKQHLELAREIASSFNDHYFDNNKGTEAYFPLPEPLILGAAPRVMSLRDGTKKMSKSDESDYSRITLTDDADTIAKKIMKSKSDAITGITYDKETRPEASNLLTIYAVLSGQTLEATQNEFASSGFGDFKKKLAELCVTTLAPITSEMNRLKSDETYLLSILKKGAEKASTIAHVNMKEIKDIVGFIDLTN